MSATTKAAPAFFTGFCGLRVPTSSHTRCPGGWQGQPCSCTCHQTCPTCGQSVPPATARQETRP